MRMGAALSIRGDMPAEELRRLARLERDGRAGMDRQTLRDWVIGFNATGVEGLGDRPRSGRPSFLGEGQMAAFKALVLRGPDPERDGVSSWTAKDLCRLVEERFGVSYSENGMLDLLHGLDLSWQKTRPIHPQADPKAQVAFKKVPGPDRRGQSRASRRPRSRGLVLGRGQDRPDRPHLPSLVPKGPSAPWPA